MEPTAQAPIIVAVDDAGSTDDAVDWAAAEAAVQRRPLRVVHALLPTPSLDPYSAGAMLVYAAGTRSAAQRLLHDAALRATSVAPELEVGTALLDGTVAPTIRRAARTACQLVVGNKGHRHGLRGLLAGSVSAGLAAHAPCPVIVVRHLDGPDTCAARVVVAVNRGRSCATAIGFAFGAARQRGIPLTLLHVWTPAGSASAGREATVELSTFVEVLGDFDAARTISSWRQAFPDVPVVAKLFVGEPAPALIAGSAGAAMLVLGSPRRRRHVGRLLGSTGRGVLDNARCPVAIVGQDRARTAPTEGGRRPTAHVAPR
jgi:nucleotide-binding universal stress UspA family protein